MNGSMDLLHRMAPAKRGESVRERWHFSPTSELYSTWWIASRATITIRMMQKQTSFIGGCASWHRGGGDRDGCGRKQQQQQNNDNVGWTIHWGRFSTPRWQHIIIGTPCTPFENFLFIWFRKRVPLWFDASNKDVLVHSGETIWKCMSQAPL